ncbi:MAG: transglutaminase-like domain-containing protein [Bacteroidia bacterium]|nr:transglutaminase-like domain-containing protein [Bacteroidia bacterium]
MQISRYSLYIILVIYSLSGCKKDNEPISSFFLFPAGRSFLGTSEIKVSINDIEYKPDTIFDSCGSYWLKIQKVDLPKSGRICIQYTRKKGELFFFKETAVDRQKWITESSYIDCNNIALKAKAIELTKDYQNNIDKAKQIHHFLIYHLILKNYQDSFLEKASRTLELGYGTCMNFSRLYVALCRAANIPARTIWGIVYDHDGGTIYDYHHQWAEVLDDNGYWHPADFNYTTDFDLNDIRYLDLIYAAEENTVIKNRSSEEIILGNVKYFNNYPATLTGRLGFELVADKRPDYMTIKYVYEF